MITAADLTRQALAGALKVKLFQLPMVTSFSMTGWLAQATTDAFSCGMECREIPALFPFTGHLWFLEARTALDEFSALADWFVRSEQSEEISNG